MIQVDVLKEENLPDEEIGSRNEIDPSSETLEELGKLLSSRFQRLKNLNERSDWETEKAEAFNSYHLIPRKRVLPFEGAANLPCPLPRIGVDSFHANVMSSLFSVGNEMRIEPLIIQAEQSNKAKKAAKYMEYVMNFEANTYESVDDSDRKCHMFGISYLEPRYVKEEKWETVETTEKKVTPTVDPQTGMVSIKEKIIKKKSKKKRTVFDGIQLDSIPVESMYFSPFFRTLEDAHKNDVIFKLCPTTYKSLKDKSQTTKDSKAIYKKAQVEKVASSICSKTQRTDSELEQARTNYTGFYYDLAPLEEMVNLAEAYLWYDVDDDDIKESVRVTFDVDSGTVIRVTLSPLRIVEFVPRPIDERLIGESIPKICTTLCDEWENFHNTRSNAGQWEHSFIGFYRAGGQFNPQQYTIKPNHFYPVADPREVFFPQMQRVGASYFQEESLLMNYFERLLAISENFQGVAAKGSQTATESMNINMRSSIRFMNPFNRIVTQMNKLINHIWDLSAECAPEEKEFYIVGTDGSPIFEKMTKDDYASRFQFKLTVQSVYDYQQVRDTMLLAYRLFLVNPIVQQHPEIMWDMSQKTLDALNLDVNLPMPDQAKVHTAYEALDLIKNGENLEPEVGIDYDHHMKVFMNALNDEDIKNWDPEAIKNMVMYIDKLKILKQTLESSNLNQSGMAPQGMMPQPGMTASRNPGQIMNNMRVSESGNSAKANAANPQPQGGTNEHLNQVLGPM